MCKGETMADNISVTCKDECANVVLSGRLDATSAPVLQEELKKLIGQKLGKLVFFAGGLEYISSAGLRVIIFAKQKIGKDTEVLLVGAQQSVLDVIKMSGLDTFLTIQDSFNG